MAVNPKRTCANRPLRSVRLTLPISVALDLEKFQKALANAARLIASRPRLADLTFLDACEFVVDPASLQVRETAAEQ